MFKKKNLTERYEINNRVFGTFMILFILLYYKVKPRQHTTRMTWKYDDCRCVCGLVETEMHVLFECTLYEEERERWTGGCRISEGWYG